MIDLNSKIQESYTKDGKELVQLIQEWIDENKSYLYYKNEKKDLKHHCKQVVNITPRGGKHE